MGLFVTLGALTAVIVPVFLVVTLVFALRDDTTDATPTVSGTPAEPLELSDVTNVILGNESVTLTRVVFAEPFAEPPAVQVSTNPPETNSAFSNVTPTVTATNVTKSRFDLTTTVPTWPNISPTGRNVGGTLINNIRVIEDTFRKRLLCCYTENSGDSKVIFSTFSTDGYVGAAWDDRVSIDVGAPTSLNSLSLVQTGPDQFLATATTASTGSIRSAVTNNGGVSWAAVVPVTADNVSFVSTAADQIGNVIALGYITGTGAKLYTSTDNGTNFDAGVVLGATPNSVALRTLLLPDGRFMAAFLDGNNFEVWSGPAGAMTNRQTPLVVPGSDFIDLGLDYATGYAVLLINTTFPGRLEVYFATDQVGSVWNPVAEEVGIEELAIRPALANSVNGIAVTHAQFGQLRFVKRVGPNQWDTLELDEAVSGEVFAYANEEAAFVVNNGTGQGQVTVIPLRVPQVTWTATGTKAA